MDDREMMRLALREAQAALRAGEVPVGAVVVLGDRVIASAHNEREQRQDPVAHAEMLALSRAAKLLGRRRLQDCTLAVTLEPCPMCAGAAMAAHVGRILYGTGDPQRGCCGSVYSLPEDPRLDGHIPCDAPVMEAECRAMLNTFFEGRRASEKA